MSLLLRRTVLFGLSLVLISNVASAQGVGTSKLFKGPTGLQLYSLRDMNKAQGPLAVLDKTKDLGFKYVEVSDTGKLTPEEYKAELAKRGLIPISRHYPYERLRDDIDGVVRDAKALGLKYAGCAWIGHKAPFDEKQCRAAAEVFNKAGAALAKEGMAFNYHNHGYEFTPYGDGTLFDLLVQQTDPKTVFFEMDVLWAFLPGQDLVKLLEKHSTRWRLFHLKDLRKGVPTGKWGGGTSTKNDVALGTGQVDWPHVLQAAQKIGVEYYFIEDESPDVLEQLPQSLRYLESVAW